MASVEQIESRVKDERKIALITGVTGQDGSYLAEFLHTKGYEVHGISRDELSATSRTYASAFRDVKFHYGQLQNSDFINNIIRNLRPSEIYNLAGQTHVATSWDEPVHTCETNGIGLLTILDAVRRNDLIKHTKIFQAGTSEMFGQPLEAPQTERTPFAPTTPYATSKVFAHWIAINHRTHYGIFVTNGILFNHESSRRGHSFRTWILTRQIAELVAGKKSCILVGDLNAQRDWGYAPDYIEGMWMTLQHDQPDDFVFATSQQHNLREFAEIAFKVAGINISWEGVKLDEIGRDSFSGRVVLRIDPKAYNLPGNRQHGDPSKIKHAIGWESQLPFPEMVKEMMEAAMRDVN